MLLLDLRGHGDSRPGLKDAFNGKYTFDYITEDMVEVIDHLHIEKSHFIGISLGTALIRNLAEKYPDRVQSMVMGGAIIRLDFRFRMLLGFWQPVQIVGSLHLVVPLVHLRHHAGEQS